MVHDQNFLIKLDYLVGLANVEHLNFLLKFDDIFFQLLFNVPILVDIKIIKFSLTSFSPT